MGAIIDAVVGIIWLVTLIWAILNVAKSSADTIGKIFWILILIIFPLFGLIIWWLVGPKSS